MSSIVQIAEATKEDELPIICSTSSHFKEALVDLKKGILNYQIWGLLGWHDIQQRYRRSALGPLWLTLSMAIMIFSLGFLYSKLFHETLKDYFPFVASGMIFWNFISTILNESCTVFIASEHIIKQIKLPFTLHICRLIWRNLIILAHNFIIFIIVYAIWGSGVSWLLLIFPVAIFISAINALWVGLLIGMLCVRFRDVPQIVASLVQMLFFVTPIMWSPTLLNKKAWLADFNPLYQIMKLLRDPLLNKPITGVTWAVVLTMTVVGCSLALLLLSKYRHRIAYWV